MNKVEFKSYEIEIEKYEDLIKKFFYDACVFGGNNVIEDYNKILQIERLIEKLIELRKTGFKQLELDKIVREIKFIDVSPMTFERPGYIDLTTFIAFRNVVNGLSDYFSSPVARPEMILKPLHKWAVVIAKVNGENVKSFVYKYLPMSVVMKREYGISK